MKSRKSVLLTALCLVLASVLLLSERAHALDAGRIHEEAMALLQAGKYEESIRKYAELIREDPDDMIALYNVACACSLLGKLEHAVGFLERSAEAGYIDFEHMLEDTDLDAIREEEGYKRILENRETYIRRAEENREGHYRKKFGDRYNYEKDDKYRILFISNSDERTRASLLGALRRYSEALWRDFFVYKPTYTITVLIPRSREDYIKDFGGRPQAAGFYNHASHTLTVNLASGTGTMIHEWTHALHYGDMEGLKQRHPIWIVEGFGSLYEQCTIRDDGTAVGLPNWRLPALQSALKNQPAKRLSWKTVMDPKSKAFKDRKTIGMAYAVARYVFYYMQEKKVLRKFYKIYRERYEEDPTGAKFMEEILGKKIDEIEKEWEPWVLGIKYDRGPVPQRQPKVRLGVYLETAEGGVGVSGVVEGSAAEKAGIRSGDVIVEVEGKAVRRTLDILQALMDRKPGDKVKLKLLRDGEKKEVEVVLDPR